MAAPTIIRSSSSTRSPSAAAGSASPPAALPPAAPSSATRPAGMLVTPGGQDVTGQMIGHVSDDDVDKVMGILQLAYPRRPIEDLVFTVNLCIPGKGISKERARLVAQAIVELQERVPIPGVAVPEFPERVGGEYVEQVFGFLRREGESWGESMLQLASTPSHVDTGTLIDLSAIPTQQMTERFAHPSLYTPGAMSALVGSRETGFNETTMTAMGSPSVSNIFDHPDGLLVINPHARGVGSNASRWDPVHVGQDVLKNKYARFWLSLCIIIPLVVVIFS